MPKSSVHCQSLYPSGNVQMVLRCLLFIALIVLMGSIARNASAQEDTIQPNWYMVIDRANLLDEGQETSAINAAWRLSTSGIPTQVVTEFAASTPELANQRANELLVANKIESAPNAGDGMLVYAAVNPDDRSDVNIGIAVGPNLLPNSGLTESDIESIRHDIVQAQLTEGHPARAIVYALREVIYQSVFTPPPIDPLPDWKKSANIIMIFAGPVIAIASVATILVRLRTVASVRNAALLLVGGLAVALLLAIFAVMARSWIGVLSAVVMLVAVILLAMSVDQRIQGTGHRQLQVTPRPPGRFVPTARKHP